MLTKSNLKAEQQATSTRAAADLSRGWGRALESPAPATLQPMIVVAGEALVDLIPTPAGDLGINPGGGPFNTARWLGAARR